jgi:hypothetical protein
LINALICAKETAAYYFALSQAKAENALAECMICAFKKQKVFNHVRKPVI